MTYFNTCTSLAELKKTMWTLAKQHHPDCGGDTVTMQAINAEYTEAVKAFSVYGRIPKTERRPYAEARRSGAAQVIQAALLAVRGLPGITIEIVGLWVWIGGETYPHREVLKTAGYKWHGSKKLWFFAGVKASGRNRPMHELRRKYGCEIVESRPELAESEHA